MITAKFTEIVEANRIRREEIKGNPLEIGVLSNLTLNNLPEILAYPLLRDGLNVAVQLGNYDNVMQDSVMMKDKRVLVILWDLANISEDFLDKCEVLTSAELGHILEGIERDLRTLFSNVSEVPLVFFSSFSAAPFVSGSH